MSARLASALLLRSGGKCPDVHSLRPASFHQKSACASSRVLASLPEMVAYCCTSSLLPAPPVGDSRHLTAPLSVFDNPSSPLFGSPAPFAKAAVIRAASASLVSVCAVAFSLLPQPCASNTRRRGNGNRHRAYHQRGAVLTFFPVLTGCGVVSTLSPSHQPRRRILFRHYGIPL